MAGRLVAQNLTKRFGALTALDCVSLEFTQGEIHAVLGENGAGKSTLMNILSGFLTPETGSVTLDEKLMPLGNPQRCRDLGVEMVHQHFTLVPEFTVEENLSLSRLNRLSTVANVENLSERALQISRELGWTIDPKAKIRNLPVGIQQRIEILKCLSGEAKVLILDEPTAVLTPDEVLDLFRVLRNLKAQNKIVILIAHKLSEVMAIADRVTVLRHGKQIATQTIEKVDAKILADWMVGEMPDLQPKSNNRSQTTGLAAKDVEVLGDRGELIVKKANLIANKGEIVGIGGVDGNGQVEFAEALARVREIRKGNVTWEDKPLREELRIAYIPQDRQVDGLALDMSVQDNLLIQGHRRTDLRRGPWLILEKVTTWAAELIQRFDIRVSSPQQPTASLSGGNQQKIVVARNLDLSPQLVIAVNPTRGLDVRATRFVHDQLRAAKESGAAIILFSTDLDELSEVADRTLFMSRGELVSAQGAESLLGATS